MMTNQTLLSMTGFAQMAGQTEGAAWRLEIKSVNSKGLDLRFRTPAGFEAFEATARTQLQSLVKRGALYCNLQVERSQNSGTIRINRPLLAEVLTLAKELGATHPLEHILAIRGIIETDEAELAITPALLADLEAALKTVSHAFIESRQAEGAHLHAILTAHVERIEQLTKAARAEAISIPQQQQERLQKQLQELLGNTPPLPPERLAHEVALLASSKDVMEELNRLEGHIAATRMLLNDGNAVGRKIDFLCQEYHREANTLCSKSDSLALTQIGIELKVTIEQLREQVQNVE